MGKRNQKRMTGFTKQERVEASIEREIEGERRREEARVKFLEVMFGIGAKES